MPYGRRSSPPRTSYQSSSRLSYDDYAGDDYDRGRDPYESRGERDYYRREGSSHNTPPPNRGDYRDRDRRHDDDDDNKYGVRDRYSGRASPPTGRFRDGSRSPYHTPSNTHYSRSRSRSRSPSDRRLRRTPPRDYARREYYDRDAPQREWDRDRDWDRERDNDRERDREHRYGGAPSRDIILEGLHDDIDEPDIRKELDILGVEGLNTVNLIRDRKTGVSRGFAFARFVSLEDSKRFLDKYYPNIDLGDACPRVRLAYSRERDEGSLGSEDWRCKNCFRCGAQRSEAATTGSLTQITPSSFSNDGTRDFGDTPSQFLLLRGLEGGVSEEVLLKGAAKLVEDPAKIMRVLLVRDRRRNESWRFGFVEFRSVDDAKAAYEKSVAMGDSFTISSKPVTTSYIHPGVFVPVFQQKPIAEKWTFEPIAGLSGGGVRLAYWDDDGYGSVLFSEGGKAVKAAAERKAKNSGKGDNGKSKARKRDEEEGSTEGGLKTKKRKGEDATKDVPGKKVIPSHLQFWQNRHSELHSKESGTAAGKDDKPASTSAASGAEQQPAPPSKSYANLDKLCCYLCSRKFNNEAEVNRHERVSALHRENMENPDKVKAAEAKLAKLANPNPSDGDGYRDRAKERRQIHQQPANPGAARGQQKAKAAAADGAEKNKKEPQDQKGPVGGKGASLLSKMGWTAGTGLGAQGTGITAPVVAGMYVEGVGLGAAGSKIGDVIDGAPGDVGNYRGFVERTKEKAKARYEEINTKESETPE